jgi:hypothetical protein
MPSMVHETGDKMDQLGVTERIEQLFATGLRAETASGIAARLGISEDEALVSLVNLVVENELILLEEGALLIFLTPARLRELELAA